MVGCDSGAYDDESFYLLDRNGNRMQIDLATWGSAAISSASQALRHCRSPCRWSRGEHPLFRAVRADAAPGSAGGWSLPTHPCRRRRGLADGLPGRLEKAAQGEPTLSIELAGIGVTPSWMFFVPPTHVAVFTRTHREQHQRQGLRVRLPEPRRT